MSDQVGYSRYQDQYDIQQNIPQNVVSNCSRNDAAPKQLQEQFFVQAPYFDLAALQKLQQRNIPIPTIENFDGSTGSDSSSYSWDKIIKVSILALLVVVGIWLLLGSSLFKTTLTLEDLSKKSAPLAGTGNGTIKTGGGSWALNTPSALDLSSFSLGI